MNAEAATPFKETVPVAGMPPKTWDGLTPTASSAAGSILRFALFDVPFSVAVTVASAVFVTALVFTVNVPLVWPAGTSTEAGTVASLLLLERDRLVPPGPAGPERVTVPVAVFPPPTAPGANVKLNNKAGVIVNVAC
jgi:hypothetical protein